MSATPGPWEWTQTVKGGGRYLTACYPRQALLYTPGTGRPNDDDAALIAAAPELLAACEAAYREICDMHQMPCEEDCSRFAAALQLRAAIAKATGEPAAVTE